MPTANYTPKERYFFIGNQTMLDTELPDLIKDKLGYYTIEEESKVYLPITLGEAAQIVIELPSDIVIRTTKHEGVIDKVVLVQKPYEYTVKAEQNKDKIIYVEEKQISIIEDNGLEGVDIEEVILGNKVISIQLSPNPLLPVKCVVNFITENDFTEALTYYGNYGITEFLTLEEFKQLNFKQINN